MGVQKFNHIGHCVADLARARRFYEEALGFRYDRELEVEGEPSARLLRLPTPLKLTAAYLVREGFTLELLHYPQPGTAPRRERAMNEPGLTHISLNVDDMPGVLAQVRDLGGEVLEETDLGAAIFIRDPDGQLIELLAAR
ncbi:MAG: VOC family protein [Dehalococcoidia bacterium]